VRTNLRGAGEGMNTLAGELLAGYRASNLFEFEQAYREALRLAMDGAAGKV